MVIGIKTLTYSASFFEDEDEQEEEPGKFEKWLLNKFGEKAEKIVMGFTVCLSIVIAVALFMILPLFIADVIEKYVPGVTQSHVPVIEGIVKIYFYWISFVNITYEGYTENIYVPRSRAQVH